MSLLEENIMSEEKPDVIIRRKNLRSPDDSIEIDEYPCLNFKKSLSCHYLRGVPAFLGEKSTV